MPAPSGRCTCPRRLRGRSGRVASPAPRWTTPRAGLGVLRMVATRCGLEVGASHRHLWSRLCLPLEQTCAEPRLMRVLRRPRPVRESHDSDSSTSRLSWESATRNLSLGLLSDGAALKPLLPDKGRRHLATTGRRGPRAAGRRLPSSSRKLERHSQPRPQPTAHLQRSPIRRGR